MSTNTEFETGHDWSRLRQDAGGVLWCGFLAAAGATMVFFAFFDPTQLGDDAAPPAWLADRNTGYAIGFFFFWAICSMAGALTAWLIDTRPAPERSSRDEG